MTLRQRLVGSAKPAMGWTMRVLRLASPRKVWREGPPAGRTVTCAKRASSVTHRTYVLHIRLAEVESGLLIWFQECAQWVGVGSDGLLE